MSVEALSRDDRAMLEAWLVGADFPMAPVVRRLLETYDDRVQALDTLRLAWNHHMDSCDSFKRLPNLPVPSFEDIRRWMNAPSDTASADIAGDSHSQSQADK